MKLEIIETPIQFRLFGKSGVVPDNRFGEVGVKLMDEMWKIVRQVKASTTGLNHWVYLPDGRLFVGIEPKLGGLVPDGLEPLQFELPRHLKHLHVGPYHTLPEKWKALKVELDARGETVGPYSLEVYGHHCNDESKLETTVLIGLQPRSD